MIIKDKLYINTKNLGFRVNKLCQLFTYKNPEYWQKKRAKLSVYNVDKFLFHYKLSNDVLELPRGALQKVLDFFKENGIQERISDQRIITDPIDITLCDTEIEHQQETILDLLLENDGGLIEMSCGGGKTVGILGYITRIKQKTLILVNEFRLASQWKGEIEKRISGNFTIGEFNGDKKEIGDITVAIINSVFIKYNEDPTFLNQFGCVITDECHKIPANMFLNVVNNTPGKYRVGVTATASRKDGKHILMFDILGDSLTSIKSHKIKHRIMNFDFKELNTNIRFDIPTVARWTGKKRELAIDFTKCLGVLVENKDRNNLLIDEIKTLITNGYFPLVLSDRVKHNKELHDRLIEMGFKATLLIGETRKKTDLNEIKNDDKLQCIIANTKIASEGLDIPRLSAIVLTCPSTNLPKLEQQVGRVRRFVPGKKTPMVVDLCDNLAIAHLDDGPVYLLNVMAKKRIKHYLQLQKEYQEIF